MSVARSIPSANAPSTSGTSVTSSTLVAVSESRQISARRGPESAPSGLPYKKMSPLESTTTLRSDPATAKLAISVMPPGENSRSVPAPASLTYTSPSASVATPSQSTGPCHMRTPGHPRWGLKLSRATWGAATSKNQRAFASGRGHSARRNHQSSYSPARSGCSEPARQAVARGRSSCLPPKRALGVPRFGVAALHLHREGQEDRKPTGHRADARRRRPGRGRDSSQEPRDGASRTQDRGGQGQGENPGQASQGT